MTLEAMEKQEKEKMKENKSKEENCVFFFFFFLPFHSTTMAPKKVLFKGQMAHGVRTLFVKLLPHLLLGPERFNSNPIMLFSVCVCVCVQTFHPPRVQQPLPSQSRYTFQSFLMKTDTTTTTTIMRHSPTVDDNKTVHHDDDDLLVISIRHFSREKEKTK